MLRRALTDWTVDYGDGPRPCSVPHAWRQDVDVRWEGPAVYATTVEVPKGGGWLVFDGVSYAARVFIEGDLVLEHYGIWDAFNVSLKGFEGKKVEVRVEVVKNGGAKYPVKDVLSGFLPYVFNTFGGIWRDVWICDVPPNLEPNAPPCRVTVKGTKIFVDGKPFYLRGVLTWGWYPELGYPNPSDEEIRREVKIAKELGFNTIKFCLWVPSHRYFEILEEEGMFAWLELPLWDPSPDATLQEKMFEEIERIVLQFRRHSNIVVWTCGCELSSNTTADFRKRLYEMVKSLTCAALVKDNSGSSEMYGGDLREYGDFYDFHPYCDLPFYPVVLDSLLIGPREKKPILLGEFNDIDVHRDLARIKKEQPYWASKDPYLNDQGVRWEPPQLPRILDQSKWSEQPCTLNEVLFGEMSHYKANYMRRRVQEAVRRSKDIAGYVLTGWRDTPISSSGVIDDWGEPRESRIKWFNGDGILFPIASRMPPWIAGGNRPAWRDPFSFFEGEIHLEIGGHSCMGQSDTLQWQLQSFVEAGMNWRTIAQGESSGYLKPNEPYSLVEIDVPNVGAGRYWLTAKLGPLRFGERIFVFRRPSSKQWLKWGLVDPANYFIGLELSGVKNWVSTEVSGPLIEKVRDGARCVLFLLGRGTSLAPFWRESAYDFADVGEEEPFIFDWPLFQSFSADRVIDINELQNFIGTINNTEVAINRIDTRTYEEAPILIRAKVGKGTLVATTLRPFGGLGVQPYGVMNNPAGAHLLERLIELAEEK